MSEWKAAYADCAVVARGHSSRKLISYDNKTDFRWLKRIIFICIYTYLLTTMYVGYLLNT